MWELSQCVYDYITVQSDIPIESIDNVDAVRLENGVIHTYATLNQIDEQPTTSFSINNGLTDHENSAGLGNKGGANGSVLNGNGHLPRSNLPGVAIYEQPIFSQSQHESAFNVSHSCSYWCSC